MTVVTEAAAKEAAARVVAATEAAAMEEVVWAAVAKEAAAREGAGLAVLETEAGAMEEPVMVGCVCRKRNRSHTQTHDKNNSTQHRSHAWSCPLRPPATCR